MTKINEKKTKISEIFNVLFVFVFLQIMSFFLESDLKKKVCSKYIVLQYIGIFCRVKLCWVSSRILRWCPRIKPYRVKKPIKIPGCLSIYSGLLKLTNFIKNSMYFKFYHPYQNEIDKFIDKTNEINSFVLPSFLVEFYNNYFYFIYLFCFFVFIIGIIQLTIVLHQYPSHFEEKTK